MSVSVIVEDEAWSRLPDIESLAVRTVDAVLRHQRQKIDQFAATVLFTNNAEMTELNASWRGKRKPTNVLSFPAPADQPVPEGEAKPLGDIVLASGVVANEATEQGKSLDFHTIHLIVHGTLHLLGYDHEHDSDAEEMEAVEVEILAGLGYPNPYQAGTNFPDHAE